MEINWLNLDPSEWEDQWLAAQLAIEEWEETHPPAPLAHPNDWEITPETPAIWLDS